MEITGDIDALLKATKGLGVARQAATKANVSAVNKTAAATRTYGVRLVAREYRLTQKQVRSEINIKRATLYHQQAMLHGSGSPGIPLLQFAPTPKRVPSTRRLARGGYSPKGGIRVMIHRGRRKMVRRSFLARMRSGHIGVFRRTGQRTRAGREQITELYGPSVMRIIDSDSYAVQLDEFAGTAMEKNLGHEVEFFFKKFGVIPKDVRLT